MTSLATTPAWQRCGMDWQLGTTLAIMFVESCHEQKQVPASDLCSGKQYRTQLVHVLLAHIFGGLAKSQSLQSGQGVSTNKDDLSHLDKSVLMQTAQYKMPQIPA